MNPAEQMEGEELSRYSNGILLYIAGVWSDVYPLLIFCPLSFSEGIQIPITRCQPLIDSQQSSGEY